jgi:hypothetical protein
MATDKYELKDALEEFDLCVSTEAEPRANALENLRFAKLGEQWPEAIRKQRELEGRPCLTINKQNAFIRQVVNDGRQNKPAIKVHPADDVADPPTAEVMNGLIRNIETTSDAEIAYDTGLDFAVTGGFGYWRVKAEYAHDDTFDQDLKIAAVPNVFSVYGDPYSQGADSSDWNRAFVTELLPKTMFESKYKGAAKVNWEMGEYANLGGNWRDGEQILVAERWTRSEVRKKILKLSDRRVVKEDWYLAKVPGGDGLTNKDVLDAFGITVTGDRETLSWKVKQHIMSGAEVLESNDWPGIYIPIVAVYGDLVNIEGRRYFRSLIDDAKDPQRMFNYWRTTSTELVALAPKAPWVGPAGSFVTDAEKWATANTQTHQFIEYDVVPEAPGASPQRQPFAGVPAGALQEAMNAADDMKAVTGIYDASLGARSNETSGRAIIARQREGDVSTFHFIDNQARAIRHTGRILIDLIPHFYNTERIIRVLGPDKKPSKVRITGGDPQRDVDGKTMVYNLALGKYDLTVETGPSFTTKREEAAYQMTEFIRAFPQAAPLIGDMLAKNMDWPEADEIARRLQAMLPPQIQGQNPQVMQMQQQIQQMAQNMANLGQELQQEKNDKALEARKLDIDAYGKETDRLKVLGGGMTPEMVQQMVLQTIQQVMQSPDVLPGAPQQGMHMMPNGQMMPDAAMPPQMPQGGSPPNPMMNQPKPPPGGFFTPGQGQ